jgi:hypothetical protein
MRITESKLRRIIREEISSVERDKKKLIVQNDDLEERGGYDIDRPAIPGGRGSHDDDLELGRMYEEDQDEFQKVRLARLRASGVPPGRAERMARSKLRHRGDRPGKG